MNQDSSKKIFFWYYFVVIAAVLFLGAASTIYTYLKVSQNTQDTLLKNVASIASILEPISIESFRGDESDLENPKYISLKNRLEKIPYVNSEIRFVYLWGYRDENIYFMIDSEPATSEDYSPPGQLYEEATEVDYDMFLKKLPSAIELSTDRWGTWLTALIPLKDENTGDLVAVMGVDMTASNYYRTIYSSTAIPLITTFFVLALIIVGSLLQRREREFMKLKSDLVSVASHEIRSPLTGITWIMESILKSADNMSEKQKYDVRIVKNKSEDLLRTINDLLDTAVVEKTSKKNLIKKPILMRVLFEEILNSSNLAVAPNNVTLSIDDSISSDITVMGDADKIKRMFDNLISNAIKYSKMGGTVIIGVTSTDLHSTFWIKDNGIGINENDLLKIFKGFFRADNAKKITSSGTGLGLHYVKQIVELYDGKIWCESKENAGSTFFVKFPKIRKAS